MFASQPMSRRAVMRTITGVGSIFLLAACGATPPASPSPAPAPTQAAAPTTAPAPTKAVAPVAQPTTGPAPKVTLIVREPYGKDWDAAVQPLAAQQLPNISINWQPWIEVTNLMTQYAAGQAPDIWRPTSNTNGFVAFKGVTKALDDYIKRDNVSLSDFWNGVQPGCTFQGKWYKWPVNYSPFYMAYNVDAMKAGGASDPWELYSSGKWDTQAVKDWMLQVDNKKPSDDKTRIFGGAVLNSPWTGFYVGTMLAFGAHWWSEDFKTITATSDQSFAAHQWLQQLFKDKTHLDVLADLSAVFGAKYQALFPAGKVGIFYGTARNFTYAWSKLTDEQKKTNQITAVGIVPSQKGPGGQGDRGFPDGLATISKTTHPDECWQVLKWVSDVGQKASWKVAPAYLPLRQSEMNDPSFTSSLVPGESMAKFQKILAVLGGWENHPAEVDLDNIVWNVLYPRMMIKLEDVKTVLTDVQAQMQKTVDELFSGV